MPDARFLTVEIKGFEALRRRAQDGFGVASGVELGIRRASAFVEAEAKRKVHKQSRKLHDSTGTNITGSGLDTEGHVGPQPGYGAPRGYTASVGPGQRIEIGGYAFHDTSRAKKRKVRRVNRGDPTEYGRYEEEGTRYRPGHPWLVPSLQNNVQRIHNIVNRAVSAALRKTT